VSLVELQDESRQNSTELFGFNVQYAPSVDPTQAGAGGAISTKGEKLVFITEVVERFMLTLTSK
jgi:hypothetical protein